MRRAHLLIAAAWLLQGAAWFLPVVTSIAGGQVEPITGWEAFLLSWRYDVLAAASAVTTVLFIFASPWAVRCGSRSIQRMSAWIAATAFLLNSHWYVLLKPDGWVSGLGIGYFLWWSSFVLLAIGLFDLAGRNDAAESTHGHVALLPR